MHGRQYTKHRRLTSTLLLFSVVFLYILHCCGSFLDDSWVFPRGFANSSWDPLIAQSSVPARRRATSWYIMIHPDTSGCTGCLPKACQRFQVQAPDRSWSLFGRLVTLERSTETRGTSGCCSHLWCLGLRSSYFGGGRCLD